MCSLNTVNVTLHVFYELWQNELLSGEKKNWLMACIKSTIRLTVDRRHSATVNLLITIHELFICLFLRNINKTIYSDITIDEKPDCCPSRWYTQSAHSFPQSVPTTSDTQTPRTIIHMQLLYAREAMV